MHGFCPASKVFFAGTLARGARELGHELPSYCHGYVRDRCREDCVAIQEISSHKLRTNGINCLTEINCLSYQGKYLEEEAEAGWRLEFGSS